MSLAVSGKKPARIAERELRLSRGKNSGGDLAVANCEIAGFLDGSGAIFGSDGGGVLRKTVHFAIVLLARHRKEAGNFRLAVRELQRRSHGCAERIFIQAICSDASGAAVHDSANGDSDSVLGNILVDGVVRKARERVDGLIDLHFGFVCAGDFAQAQDGINMLFEIAFGEEMRFARLEFFEYRHSVSVPRMQRPFSRCGNARAMHRGPCPWSAWADLYRSSACPTTSNILYRKGHRNCSRIRW